jgi:hypothetical protein
MNYRHALGVIYLVTVLSVMIGALWAEEQCVTLPADAGESQIKVASIKLLAEHTQNRSELQGLTVLEEGKLSEEITRRAYGYTKPGDVVVVRSDERIRLCLNKPKVE